MRARGSWVVTVVLLCILPAPAGAIYGGAPVPGDEGGAVVLFGWRLGGLSGTCSGTLITPTAVLTAGHCVRSLDGRAFKVREVRVGNPAGRTARPRVKEVRVHPDYDPRKPEAGNDLAILILATPVADHTPLRVAQPADDPTEQGELVTVSGFGLTPRRGRLVLTRKLLGASLEYLSPYACFSGPVKEMSKTRMCGASPTAGVCPGDSGGPATRVISGETVLVGVISLAIDETQCVDGATVLTRVSAFAEWVEETAR